MMLYKIKDTHQLGRLRFEPDGRKSDGILHEDDLVYLLEEISGFSQPKPIAFVVHFKFLTKHGIRYCTLLNYTRKRNNWKRAKSYMKLFDDCFGEAK